MNQSARIEESSEEDELLRDQTVNHRPLKRMRTVSPV